MKMKPPYILYLLVFLFCLTACTGSPLPTLPPTSSQEETVTTKAIPLPSDERVFQFEQSTPEIKTQTLQNYDFSPLFGYYDNYPDYYTRSIYAVLPEIDPPTIPAIEMTFVRINHDGSKQSAVTTIPSNYYFRNVYFADQYWFYQLSSLTKPDKSEKFHSPSELYMRLSVNG